MQLLPYEAPQVDSDTVSLVRPVCGGGVEVYDIQVEGTHNFFAGEVLVHNCILIDDLIKNGKAKFEGDRKPFDQLRSTLTQFAPDFELIPGTKTGKASPVPKPKDPFEVIKSDTKGVP